MGGGGWMMVILSFPVILHSIALSINVINFLFIILSFSLSRLLSFFIFYCLVTMIVLIVLVTHEAHSIFCFVETHTMFFIIINIMSIKSIFQINMFSFLSLHQIKLWKKRSNETFSDLNPLQNSNLLVRFLFLCYFALHT